MPDQHPEPHPMIHDKIESERCPDCGTPGVVIGRSWPLVKMACPRCEPELIQDGEDN